MPIFQLHKILSTITFKESRGTIAITWVYQLQGLEWKRFNKIPLYDVNSAIN